MKNYPKELYYLGNSDLLQKQKVSIVGSRKPNKYAVNKTYEIANKLSKRGVVIVSGGALGIDTIAHKASGLNNTIMVSGTGLDIRYPTINKTMIKEIEQNGLVLSQFKTDTPSLRRNFVLRNEIIVALGDVLIVSYADTNSGTMRSVEYGLKMGKKIYVLPHRIGESEGTNYLLENKLATPILNIDKFVEQFGNDLTKKIETKDDILDFCKNNPSYEEAYKKFGETILEYELNGDIIINNGTIFVT